MPTLASLYSQVQQQWHADDAVLREALLLAILPIQADDEGMLHIPVSASSDEVAMISPDDLCSLCTDGLEEEDDIPFGAAACVHVLAAALYRALAVPVAAAAVPVPVLPRADNHEPHSMTVKTVDRDGYEWLICVRSSSTEAEVDALFTNARRVKEKLQKYQWTPPGYARPQPPVPSPGTAAAPEPDTAPGPETPAAVAVPAPTSNGASFQADRLAREERGGKYLWSVYGPNMPRACAKFGMRVWPEVLEAAGFVLADLEALRSTALPPLTGWRAEYAMRQDDTSRPDKVTKLVKL